MKKLPQCFYDCFLFLKKTTTTKPRQNLPSHPTPSEKVKAKISYKKFTQETGVKLTGGARTSDSTVAWALDRGLMFQQYESWSLDSTLNHILRQACLSRTKSSISRKQIKGKRETRCSQGSRGEKKEKKKESWQKYIRTCWEKERWMRRNANVHST